MSSFVGSAWGGAAQAPAPSLSGSTPSGFATQPTPFGQNPFAAAASNGAPPASHNPFAAATQNTNPVPATRSNPFSSVGAPLPQEPLKNPFASAPPGQQPLPSTSPFHTASQGRPNLGPFSNLPQPSRTPSPFSSGGNQGRHATPFSTTSASITQPSHSTTTSALGTLAQQPSSHGFGTVADDTLSSGDSSGDSKWTKRKRKPPNPEQSKTNLADQIRKNMAPSEPTSKMNATKGGGFGGGNATRFSSAKDQNVSNDPYARKILEQLAKDGVRPPRWPADPGNPSSASAMASFKDAYRAYRDKARASLVKAKLIDDPDDRKRLEDAIDFKGICEDMCPEYEKVVRITEFDVQQAEKDPFTSIPTTSRMVKKLARSAAGQEAPLPMDVRSFSALRKTLDYLIDDFLKSDDNLPLVHGFLWDRTRAIRRDFAFFSAINPEEMHLQVYCLENIVRFHATSLHLLSQKGFAPEDFSEQQEVEQLGKSLISLMYAYNDCGARGVPCGNEAEFRAYQLLFRASHPNILEDVQRDWDRRFWTESDLVRTAVSLVEAMHNTSDFHGPLGGGPSFAAASAYNSYFRIVEDPQVSFTMACFAELHFGTIRRSILAGLIKAFARPRGPPTRDITASVLNSYLRFDSIEEAVEFAELHGLRFSPDESDPDDIARSCLVLEYGKSLEYPRIHHSFSHNLVEKKRGARPLPDVIHTSVFEAATDIALQSPDEEDSLFMPQKPAFKDTKKHVRFADIEAEPDNISPGIGQAPGSPFPMSVSSPSILNKENQPSLPSFPASKPQQVSPAATPGAQPSPFDGLLRKSTTSSFAGLSAASSSVSSSPFGTNAQTPFAPAASTPKSAQLPNAPTPTFPLPSATGGTTKEGVSPFPSISKNGFLPAGSTPSQPAIAPSLLSVPSDQVTPPTPQFKLPSVTATPSSVLGGLSTPTNTVSNTTSLGSLPTPKAADPQTNTVTSLGIPRGNEGMPSSTSLTDSRALPTGPGVVQSRPPKAPTLGPAQLLDKLAQWYVKGDNGLMSDFEKYMIEQIVQETFTRFEEDEAERKRKEEEEQALKEAEAFRVYNLRLKFFYRWRDIARERALSYLRRSGRDQMRAYQEELRATRLAAKKKAQKAREVQEMQVHHTDNVENFRGLLKRRTQSVQETERGLLESGILSGSRNEANAISRVIHDRDSPITDSGSFSRGGTPSFSQSTSRFSPGRIGAKTQALRDEFSQSSYFRRSLPVSSASSRYSPSVDDGHSRPFSRVSDRWRLKAMGLVTMPDGTALAEVLARPMKSEGKRYVGLGSFGLPTQPRSRRATMTDIGTDDSAREPRPTDVVESLLVSPPSRKRPAEDSFATNSPNGMPSDSKRIFLDAEATVREMRKLREEVESGIGWYKEQNERLQDELSSRGGTPWGEA